VEGGRNKLLPLAKSASGVEERVRELLIKGAAEVRWRTGKGAAERAEALSAGHSGGEMTTARCNPRRAASHMQATVRASSAAASRLMMHSLAVAA
jgi:hypothetical protein